MIIGIGSDIVNISRIERLLHRFEDRFLVKIFTQKEIEIGQFRAAQKVAYFAKRFAAKEAFSKALGTGFRNGLRFQDIEILNDEYGKPKILLYRGAKDIFVKKAGSSIIHVSLSDDMPFAQAFVVIESHS